MLIRADPFTHQRWVEDIVFRDLITWDAPPT